MISVDENLLFDLRLNQMTAGDKNRLISEIGQALEARLGDTLAHAMSDEEVAQFDQLKAQGDAAAQEQWLLQRFPNYKEIAITELNLIKQEIKQNGRIINQSSSRFPFEEAQGNVEAPTQSSEQPATQPQPTEPMPMPRQSQPIQREPVERPAEPGTRIDPTR